MYLTLRIMKILKTLFQFMEENVLLAVKCKNSANLTGDHAQDSHPGAQIRKQTIEDLKRSTRGFRSNESGQLFSDLPFVGIPCGACYYLDLQMLFKAQCMGYFKDMAQCSTSHTLYSQILTLHSPVYASIFLCISPIPHPSAFLLIHGVYWQ